MLTSSVLTLNGRVQYAALPSELGSKLTNCDIFKAKHTRQLHRFLPALLEIILEELVVGCRRGRKHDHSPPCLQDKRESFRFRAAVTARAAREVRSCALYVQSEPITSDSLTLLFQPEKNVFTPIPHSQSPAFYSDLWGEILLFFIHLINIFIYYYFV